MLFNFIKLKSTLGYAVEQRELQLRLKCLSKQSNAGMT